MIINKQSLKPKKGIHMPKKSHHVVPAPSGGWNVKKGGATRASKHFEKKEDAIAWGNEVSKKQGSEFVIHKKDGTIARRASHGRDPFPPRDRDTNK
jgi:hypothetical protein